MGVPYDVIIRNGMIVSTEGVEAKAIGIADGKIVELAEEIGGDGRETIDAHGLHVFPGVMDPHVHFNDAGTGGRSDWEGIETGSAALAASGGTAFFDMPLNSSPPTLDGKAFDLKAAAGKATARTDFGLWGGLTPGNVDRMEELAERGVIGFKAFMSNSGMADFERADDLTLWRGMKKAKKLGLPVAVHAESEEITSRLTAEAVAAGKMSVRDYLDSRPIVAEVEATARAICLAEETGCKLHIVHVANSRSSELVRLAAARGADVTCETCPHYLTLSGEDMERIGARAKCAPPLRTPADIDELWRDLVDGKFAFVASDHSPSPPEMKEGADFFKVWGGIAGIQATLPVLLSRGPGVPLALVGKLTATHVARRFGIEGKGEIRAGFDADLALVNIAACYELTREMLFDRHKQSPYVGRCFHGRVERTMVRGRTIYAQGRFPVGPGGGRLLTPARRA
jgi:allantoinase